VGFTRRRIAISGIFLTVIGSIFFTFGLWYAWTYGIDRTVSPWDVLVPYFGENLLSLIVLSGSTTVLGIIFILWAYKFPKDSKH